jgi:hypothetical protein
MRRSAASELPRPVKCGMGRVAPSTGPIDQALTKRWSTAPTDTAYGIRGDISREGLGRAP